MAGLTASAPRLPATGASLVLMKRGQNVGYQGYLILYPASGQGMVVMTNSDNGSMLAEALIRRAASAYGWPELPPVLPTDLSHPLASVTKRHYIIGPSRRAEGGLRRSTMPAWFRAGLFAALFVFAATPLTPASAEKTFQDAALDDAAIKLEADLKDEAGTVEKPVIKLRKDADARCERAMSRAPPDIYVQIVTRRAE